MDSTQTRTETDALGSREIPADALYGIHTLRSIENFSIAQQRMPLSIIYGMTHLKRACARANAELGLLSDEKRDAIVAACGDILAGAHGEAFCIDIFQAGSGTSSHMNLNEVIANLANQRLGAPLGAKSPIHPNDDVNKGQSTNDVFPSGAKLAILDTCRGLQESLSTLTLALRRKEQEFSGILKAGRTHLQDAVPITLGQEFGAWAQATEHTNQELEPSLHRLKELAIGGNAVGTGVNTPAAFQTKVIHHLNSEHTEAFFPTKDNICLTQFMTDFSRVSASLRAVAMDLQIICNDLRLLSSGPHTGLDEIRLPPVEPGSSIMPGKINPSICEAVNMACMHVQGLDMAVSLACGAGQLELNTHMPIIAVDTLHSAELLSRACIALAQKCIPGISAQPDNCRANLERSAGLPTILSPQLGYDRVAALVKESVATKRTIKELILEKQILTEAEYDILLQSATGPNL